MIFTEQVRSKKALAAAVEEGCKVFVLWPRKDAAIRGKAFEQREVQVTNIGARGGVGVECRGCEMVVSVLSLHVSRPQERTIG